MTDKSKPPSVEPDAHLHALIEKAEAITQNWAKRHDIWYDAGHHDPVKHYDSEPGKGGPILLFWSEGAAMRVISYDEPEAMALRDELENIGLYMEQDDNVTAGYYLIDQDSALQNEFDRLAQWKWTCRLIEADAAEVSGDLYAWFAEHPDDFRRLPPLEFEKLISSVFTARGWRTEVGPGSGDKGVDVRMWLETPLGETLTLVQAKRYAPGNPIKLEAVAALEAHSQREEADGLFVTTSRYLPGVRKWASRNKRLVLADSTNLQSWCQAAAQQARTDRIRALAIEAWQPLIREIAATGGVHNRLVVATVQAYPAFCVVLKETATAALLINIPSRRVSGDFQRGQVVPILDGTTVKDFFSGVEVFRAIRSDHAQRGVTYWGDRRLYSVWNGQPVTFDHWD